MAKNKFGKFLCDAHVTTLTKITEEMAHRLMTVTDDTGRSVKFLDTPFTGVVTIDYPLRKPTTVGVVNCDSVGVLLHKIAMRYKEIYSTLNVKKFNKGEDGGDYKVWGHGMDDLYIESFTFDYMKHTCELGVGS